MNPENLTQMRRDLPNMYLIAMRGDSKVRISYNTAAEVVDGPAYAVEGADTDRAPEDEAIAPDVAKHDDPDAQLVEYFADLAEEAGMSDVAEELNSFESTEGQSDFIVDLTAKPKPKRKTVGADTGETPVKRKRAKKEA